MKLNQALPALEWLRGYSRESLISDGLAAIIVTIMLIPQSLAYALLAGLPAEMGLYASILPLIAYALFGSSRTLSVGPGCRCVADDRVCGGRSRITGRSGLCERGDIACPNGWLDADRYGACLSSVFVSHFLSQPVVSGFITASGHHHSPGATGPFARA
jgi:SulP family sulfate permease